MDNSHPIPARTDRRVRRGTGERRTSHHRQQRTVLETVAGSVPWAMDQDVLSEGIDEALCKDPELSSMLGWPPEAE